VRARILGGPTGVAIVVVAVDEIDTEVVVLAMLSRAKRRFGFTAMVEVSISGMCIRWRLMKR
jgi:hypothetical protein